MWTFGWVGEDSELAAGFTKRGLEDPAGRRPGRDEAGARLRPPASKDRAGNGEESGRTGRKDPAEGAAADRPARAQNPLPPLVNPEP